MQLPLRIFKDDKIVHVGEAFILLCSAREVLQTRLFRKKYNETGVFF